MLKLSVGVRQRPHCPNTDKTYLCRTPYLEGCNKVVIHTMAFNQYNLFDNKRLIQDTFSPSKQTRNTLETSRACRIRVGVDRIPGMLARETLQRKTVSWNLPAFFGLGTFATSQRNLDSPLDSQPRSVRLEGSRQRTIEDMRSP